MPEYPLDEPEYFDFEPEDEELVFLGGGLFFLIFIPRLFLPPLPASATGATNHQLSESNNKSLTNVFM